MLNLLLEMSYIMIRELNSKFQSHGIKIEYFKIIPINPFNPISTKVGVKIRDGHRIFFL